MIVRETSVHAQNKNNLTKAVNYMSNLIDTLAATTLTVVVAAAVPNLGIASENAPLNPVKLARTGRLIVFAENDTNQQHPARINVMLKGYDPVAYFEQGKAVRGERSIWSTYNGVTYFFASKGDKTKFDQNPKEFEPQYGGFCAHSMANGRKEKSDPTLFSIHQGKLYVYRTPALKSQFTSNPATHISKADNNWLKLGPATFNSEEHSFDDPWTFGQESTQQ